MLRESLVALAVACAAGCGDPAVEVSFTVPADYRALVAAVVLEVLAPPAAEPFGCDQLAFGEVAPETAALALVQQVAVRGGGSAPLSGIPRTGAKLLVARGLDGADNAVVAACAELGDIDGDVAVELIGEPT